MKKNDADKPEQSDIKRFINHMAKKSDKWWIEIWQTIAVAAFFTGILISAKFNEYQANKVLNDVIEEFVENNPCLTMNPTGEIFETENGSYNINIEEYLEYMDNKASSG